MGGPGFYGPMGGALDTGPPHATDSLIAPDSLSGLPTGNEEVKKEVKGENDKKEKHGPSREAFMEPTFGGFYDDLAAGPPLDALPPGDRPYERGIIKRIDRDIRNNLF